MSGTTPTLEIVDESNIVHMNILSNGLEFPLVSYETVAGAGAAQYVWAGAQSSESFVVAAKIDNSTGDVSLKVSTSTDLSNPIVGIPVVLDTNGFVKCGIGSLTPNTGYYWKLFQGDTAISDLGWTKTFPVNAADFSVGFGHCFTGTIGQAFDRVSTQAPLMFIHLGDWHYRDEFSTVPSDHANWLVNKITTTPELKTMLTIVPTYYIRSDHDGGGGDNSDPDTYYIANQTAYKQVVPHQALQDQPTDALYTAWTVGRVRFIQLDTRTIYRSDSADLDGPSKTMLGAAQKAWLLNELDGPEPLKIMLSDPPWVGSSLADSVKDKWPNYATERQEIANYITANGVNVIMLVGDFHAVLSSTDANNPQGGFPVIAAGPLWQSGGASGTANYDYRLDAGAEKVSRYGMLDFVDDGTTIDCTFTAHDAADDSTLYTDSWSFSAVAGAIVGDEFNVDGLNTDLWTPICPQSTDGLVDVTGGSLNLSFLAGSEHNVYNDDESWGIEQSIGNADFAVQAKFLDPGAVQYQGNEIMVRQDYTDNWIRFSIYSDGSDLYAFIATRIGGVSSSRVNTSISSRSEAYIQVTRTGNDWDFDVSDDGNTWQDIKTFTEAMTVTSIGPAISNATPFPAFSGRCDWFRNVT